jgi:hypothetical protein
MSTFLGAPGGGYWVSSLEASFATEAIRGNTENTPMLRIHPNDLTSHGKHFFLLRSDRERPMTLDVRCAGSERTFAVDEGFVLDQDGARLSAILCTDRSAYTIENPDKLAELVDKTPSVPA